MLVLFFCRNIGENNGRNIFTIERMFAIIKGEYIFDIDAIVIAIIVQ